MKFNFKRFFCKKYAEEIEILEEQLVLALDANSKLNSEADALKLKIQGLEILLKDATFLEKPLVYEEPKKLFYTEIQEKFGTDAIRMFPTDYYAYGIDKEDVEAILDRNRQISDAKYLEEKFDCDDFASATLGLFNQPTLGRFAFGYAVSKVHAYNFFVDRAGELWIVEPQNRRIMSLAKAVMDDKYKTIKYFV